MLTCETTVGMPSLELFSGPSISFDPLPLSRPGVDLRSVQSNIPEGTNDDLTTIRRTTHMLTGTGGYDHGRYSSKDACAR